MMAATLLQILSLFHTHTHIHTQKEHKHTIVCVLNARLLRTRMNRSESFVYETNVYFRLVQEPYSFTVQMALYSLLTLYFKIVRYVHFVLYCHIASSCYFVAGCTIKCRGDILLLRIFIRRDAFNPWRFSCVCYIFVAMYPYHYYKTRKDASLPFSRLIR